MEGSDAAATSIAPAPAAVQAATATFPKRKNRANLRKKDAEEEEEEQNDQSAVVKKAKQARGDSLMFTTKTDRAEDLSGVQYQANQAIQSGRDSLATAKLETETETDRDARCGLGHAPCRDLCIVSMLVHAWRSTCIVQLVIS